MDELEKEIGERVRAARAAGRQLAVAEAGSRNRCLVELRKLLAAAGGEVLAANRRDVEAARAAGRNQAYLDRLELTGARLERLAGSLDEVAALPDPLNQVRWETTRPNGLRVRQVSTPIGVIAIIYESRPDVTIEAAALCLKSGNAVVLKGGSDSLDSNEVFEALLHRALRAAGLPPEAVYLVKSREHRAVDFLLSRTEDLDLVIPRGGEGLIRTVVEKSRVPVIKHYKGVCHTYVDRAADLEMAWTVTLNAKAQRPATCNATETLLVHREIAGSFLPEMGRRFAAGGVRMRGCPETLRLIPGAEPAREDDWGFEFLDLVIAIRVVASLEEAIAWVNRYGTGHSEAIITADPAAAERFLAEVDAAAVYHNASTRFTDGFEFGLGAEIGISTDRIHARGPMGLRELTSYKYLVYGSGQLRS